MIWLLIVIVALRVCCRVASLIGERATMAIVWSCCVAFTLGSAYGIYADTKGIGGGLAAVAFLVLAAYFISRDFRSKPQRTDFNEQK